MFESHIRLTRRGLIAGAAGGVVLAATRHAALGVAGPAPSGSADAASGGDSLAGWEKASPREEIRPQFDVDRGGGPQGRPALVIRADAREGLDGCWKRSFPVTPGRHYRFSAVCRAQDVAVPRRSVVVKLNWRDARDQPVALDEPAVQGILQGMKPMAETEFPAVVAMRPDGWTEMAGTYRAPAGATQLVVQLHLQWAPSATVRWSDVSVVETQPPPPRTVRLAAVHFRPSGGRTAADNCRMYEPLVAEAARQKADLIVLGETLTYVNVGKAMHEVAEPVPGPSTEYFGRLAKQHKCYIVAGLVERDGHLVYNVAALLGPDGK